MQYLNTIDKRIKVLTESGKVRAFHTVADAKKFVAIAGGKVVYCQVVSDNPWCKRVRGK